MSEKTPQKPTKDVIYVDVDDEITSIIDKVDNSAHKVVALVLPKRAASLQSIVNMKLLKRSADTAGKNVVLITNEHALTPLAGAAGLHVAKNLQSKPEVPDAPVGAAVATAAVAAKLGQRDDGDVEETPEVASEEDLPDKFNYDEPVGELADKHDAENPETIDLDNEDEEEKPAKTAHAKKAKNKDKVSVPNFDKFRMMLGIGALALVALIVFLVMAIKVLPKAIITINTTSEPLSTSFNLTASTSAKELDTKKGVIPAKLQTKDQTGSTEVTATGKKNNGDKATGSITFSIPCASVSGSPPQIPGGTGVSTSGLTFITQSTATLNNPDFSGGCHFTDSANIVASAAGSKYNVSDATFTISGSYPNVSASGSASGGSDDIVTILSQDDVDGAKQKLTSGTTGEEFKKEFEKSLTDDGYYVLSSTLKTTDAKITATPAVGEPADKANVNVKVTYSVLAVKKDDLTKVIDTKVSGEIDKTKQKLSDNLLDDTTITVQGQSNSKTAMLAVDVDTSVVPIIDVTLVKNQSKGHKTGDIQSAIGGWPGVKTVEVKLSPFWVSKVPTKDKKITVVVKEVKSSSSDSAP